MEFTSSLTLNLVFWLRSGHKTRMKSDYMEFKPWLTLLLHFSLGCFRTAIAEIRFYGVKTLVYSFLSPDLEG